MFVKLSSQVRNMSNKKKKKKKKRKRKTAEALRVETCSTSIIIGPNVGTSALHVL